MRIGVLPHGSNARARALVPELVDWIAARGHQACLVPSDAKAFAFEDAACERDDFRALDLLVVLGGDGTVLHGVELAGFAGVPILGVNLGTLGFLTETGPESLYDALERTISGDRKLDSRTTVAVHIARGDGSRSELGEAINEVSVERGVGGKMIRMTLTIGDQAFTSFGADGLIVATPTGSTAYAFSMRGPIVAPEMRSLVVVAVGAHSLFDRPLVVADGQEIQIAVRHGGRGVVVMDGRPRTEIGEGDALRASVGPSTVRLVRLGPDSYFTRVARKFGLPPV
jgi:NAD+ kinase